MLGSGHGSRPPLQERTVVQGVGRGGNSRAGQLPSFAPATRGESIPEGDVH